MNKEDRKLFEHCRLNLCGTEIFKRCKKGGSHCYQRIKLAVALIDLKRSVNEALGDLKAGCQIDKVEKFVKGFWK